MARSQITLNELLNKKVRYCDQNSDNISSLFVKTLISEFQTKKFDHFQFKGTVSTFHYIIIKVLINN
jgi:hypothetical protein